MNDFTKEELEYIADCVDFGILDRNRNDNFLYMDEKLQSMIENYCEHSQHIYYEDIPAGECTECHMVMIP